jgi:uncharacterized protein (TIGR02611 family)
VAEPTSEHRFLAFVRRHRERHQERNRVVRYVIAFIGFVVVLAGLVMSVPFVPGPGVLVVAIGLMILALEFAWAERLLERTVLQLERAGKMARDASRAQQLLIVGAFAVVAVAFAAALIALDLPLVPG